MEIHHVGYLVDDLAGAAEEMRGLGYISLGEVVRDEERYALITFLENKGYVIELIQPIDQTSPVYGLRKKYRNAPYHICYKTKDINKMIAKLCANPGYTLITPPRPASAIRSVFSESLPMQSGTPEDIAGPLVAFLMNARIGMIELVETK